MHIKIPFTYSLILSFFVLSCTSSKKVYSQDLVADNMLMLQKQSGGWPKQLDKKPVVYTKEFTIEEKAKIAVEHSTDDATIDNSATTKEIRYLLKAYQQYKIEKYLVAAEKGIQYLLDAQYKNTGGWPQFYPDKSSYRSQITFNDNAMINAMKVLQDVSLQQNEFALVNNKFVDPSKQAVAKGIDCILQLQIKVNNQLTAWCTQYDAKSLKPAKARAFELASISAAESVGIVEFLMSQPNPSPAIKEAIHAAVKWLDASKIVGYNFIEVPAPDLQTGKDKVFVQDPNSTIWARFYDIDTNEPFVCGRNGEKKKDVKDIEHERRIGYGWYGTWPKNLLEKKYPKWLAANPQ